MKARIFRNRYRFFILAVSFLVYTACTKDVVTDPFIYKGKSWAGSTKVSVSAAGSFINVEPFTPYQEFG